MKDWCYNRDWSERRWKEEGNNREKRGKDAYVLGSTTSTCHTLWPADVTFVLSSYLNLYFAA
jgi:hypothetical protein